MNNVINNYIFKVLNYEYLQMIVVVRLVNVEMLCWAGLGNVIAIPVVAILYQSSINK